MSIRFTSYLLAAVAALVVFGLLADLIHSSTAFALAIVLTTAVALGVMYGTEWLARLVRSRRRGISNGASRV